MKIAEGSTCEFEVIVYGSKIELSQQRMDSIIIHVDDIPELIKELERISKGE